MFTNQIGEILSNALGEKHSVSRLVPLYGGDINQVYRIEGDHKDYCIKLNSSTKYPDIFLKEAEGLNLLRKSEFRVPEVISHGTIEDKAYLIMEYIPKGEKKEGFWKDFGARLAKMHMLTDDAYGLGSDNYIATLHQSNSRHMSWSQFYYRERLLPLVKLGVARKLLSNKDLDDVHYFYDVLDELFPRGQASLLHGDLWSGNFLVSDKNEPVLIDPAVYYGQREMDIAMTMLFGGFENEMYDSYNEVFPLPGNWQERVKVCKLYPLLVHVNLFGGHYVEQYRSIIKRYVTAS